uniref:Putative transcriptional regulator n=1 Tax=Chlorobium phaeobacteroides (strain BS1) TaxID=331678 RepID=B3EPX9_CHLPB
MAALSLILLIVNSSDMSLTWSQLEDMPLLDIIGQGETRHTEFKRLVHSPSKIAKSIVAFANTEGGIILIGVDDDKRIVGIHSEKEMLEIVYDAVKLHIDPTVGIETEILEYKRRLVLAVHVPESDDKPHYHLEEQRDPDTLKMIMQRKVYMREESHNKVATKDKVCLMKAIRNPLKLSFGTNEKMLLGYLKKNPSITADEFSSLAGIPMQKAMQTLIALVRSGAIKLCTKGRESFYSLQNG